MLFSIYIKCSDIANALYYLYADDSVFYSFDRSLECAFVKRAFQEVVAKGEFSTLDQLYHSALRFVTGADYHTLNGELYKTAALPPLVVCRKAHLLKNKNSPYVFDQKIVKTGQQLQSSIPDAFHICNTTH